MSQPSPSPQDITLWQKRLAAQANNRAWRLSESSSRSPAETEEMLHAAHAAMHLWSIVGTDNHKAHAIQLLAHVHALLGHAEAASTYLDACSPYLSSPERQDWETALFHAVAANVAAASSNAEDHRRHHARARESIDALADPEDKAILEATMAVVPPWKARVTDANPAVAEMEARVARFRELQPTDDYLDAAIPGCERTTYRVLGTPPSAPLAAQGFHLNIVRCEPGKSAPLHSHVTQEVFVALTGRWEVFWGPAGERNVVLEPWDTVAIPAGLSRGFKNVGPEPAHLMGMASGRDPGQIDWPAQVRAAALAVGVDLP